LRKTLVDRSSMAKDTAANSPRKQKVMTNVFMANRELMLVDKSGLYIPKQLVFRLH